MIARPLAHQAWPDVPTRPMVLVPVGSCEQHGPHLPLVTDTTIAVALAEGLSDRLAAPDRPVVVAPPLAYTASGEHQAFAGTISIGIEALRLTLVELVRSLRTWCGRVVFVNAHGGNARALGNAVAQLRWEGHPVAWVAAEAGSATDTHAGYTETALMLHLAPELVDMTRAEAGSSVPITELMPALTTGGVAAVAPSGILGDPTAATARDGKAIMLRMVDRAAALVVSGQPDDAGRLRPAPGAAAAGAAPAAPGTAP